MRFWRFVARAVLVVAALLTVQQAFRFIDDDRLRSPRSHEALARDIYFLWLDGARILEGQNPYDRVLRGDMRRNDKYPTYLPGFYLLSAATQALGLRDHASWVVAWRHVFLVFDLGIAVLILKICRSHDLELVGLLGGTLWLLNRWTVYVLSVGQIDFIPIFCLLLSLHWLDRRRDVSLLLLGASLAFKHFAALLLPAYAIWIWRTSHDRQRSLARAAALAGLAPLLVSLPVLLWGPEGLVRSVLFSLTRDPDSFGRIQSIDAVLGLSGPAARLPLATMLLFVSVLTATGRIGRYTTALLTMTVLVDFNSVLFAQYIAWVVPFVPLSICDGRPERVPAAPGSG